MIQTTNADLATATLSPIIKSPNQFQPTTGLLPISQPIAIFNPTTNIGKLTTEPAVTSTPTTSAAPVQVWNLVATTEHYKVNNTMYLLLSVTFSAVSSFQGVNVWLTGYHGNLTPVLVASGQGSPLSFLVDTTGETVTITAVAFNDDGTSADFNSAPAIAIVLNGVSSAPPAPTVSTPLSAYSGGYQFTFNYLTGILTTIITGYNVYRNTSANTFAGSTKIRNVPQDSTGTGAYVFQDTINQGSLTYYYFVTSVDVYGNESTATAAQSGSVQSIVIGYQGAWSSTVAYTEGAEVLLSGTVYLCILANTNQTPPNPTYWTPINNLSYAGEWSGSTTYSVGQTVSVSGALYIAIAASTNKNPTSTTGFWQLLTASVNFIGTFNGSQVYAAGSMVVYNGSFWVAITAVPAGNTPAPGSSYWENTGTSAIKLAAYDNGLAYSIGMETVGTDGNIYQATAATTGNAPPNASYWQLVGPNALTSVPGSSTYLNAVLSLFSGPTWSSSNNFRPVTNSVGGTTASTSYATVGSFLMNFVGNINTYGGVMTLTQTVAPYADFAAGNPNAAITTGPGTAWSNPTNAETLNSVGATCALSASGLSQSLRVSFPSLGIPTDHTILGLTVTVVRRKSTGAGTLNDASLFFRKAGSANGNDFADLITAWPGSYTTKTYGGTANLLGGTWAPADFNSNDNVDLNLSSTAVTNPATADVDWISFSVRTNGGTFTASARIRVGGNDGTVATLTGVGPTAGTSFISAPATGNQTVTVEAEVTSTYGGTVQALFSQIDALPQSGSQFT